MKIPLLDVGRMHAGLEEELVAAARAVILDGRYIMGPEIGRFEEEMARYLGTGHAIGVSSGTDALLAALSVLFRRRGGGRVITTPFTFIATAEAIVAAGFEPLFLDIVPETGLLDLGQLPDHPQGIVGIVPVHLFGQCLPMTPLLEYARQHGMWVVEDGAQCLGAAWDGRMAGTMGEFGCFSFFPSKNLGGFGDGGLVATADPELARWVRAARVHGVLNRKYNSDFLSGNYRLDTLQAALLRVKLRHVDRWNEQRREAAARYLSLLGQAGLIAGGQIRPLSPVAGSTHVFHQFVVRAERRDELAAALSDAGIATAVYYPVPLHVQPAFASLGLPAQAFPAAMELASQALALPLFPGITALEQEEVVGRIRSFWPGRNG